MLCGSETYSQRFHIEQVVEMNLIERLLVNEAPPRDYKERLGIKSQVVVSLTTRYAIRSVAVTENSACGDCVLLAQTLLL